MVEAPTENINGQTYLLKEEKKKKAVCGKFRIRLVGFKPRASAWEPRAIPIYPAAK